MTHKFVAFLVSKARVHWKVPVYRENAFGECKTRMWFYRFKECHFGKNQCPCLKRPFDFGEDDLTPLIHDDSRRSVVELAVK